MRAATANYTATSGSSAASQFGLVAGLVRRGSLVVDEVLEVCDTAVETLDSIDTSCSAVGSFTVEALQELVVKAGYEAVAVRALISGWNWK